MRTLQPVPRTAGRTGPARPAARPALAWLRHPVVASALLAAVAQGLWAVFLATDGGDMAAQYAWTRFAAAHPASLYDLAWYGGMHVASYSVLAPALMAWLGVRTTAVLAGTLAAALFAALPRRAPLRDRLAPSLVAALALAGDTASGRITFSIGVCLGLAAVLVMCAGRRPDGGQGRPWGRTLAAAALGALATMASPVAGLFLLVAAAAMLLTGRRVAAVALGVGPPLVVGATTALFPFYGVQPYSLASALLPVVTALAVALLAPRGWRAVRAGAWVYVAGVALTLLIPSPIGSNVERLPLLFAAPVLLAAARQAGPVHGAGSRPSAIRVVALWLAFAVALGWQTVKPLGDLATARPAAAWDGYAGPLIAELGRLGADRARVEAVPTRTHWESAGLAPYVELARGWNRQADVERDPLFYGGRPLDASAYHAWLRTWAVGYVVLPKAPLDFAAAAEGRIVSAGQPWLRLVWHDAHWRVYRVTDAVPLADPPASVERADAAAVTVRMPRAGSVLIRVAWSPWLGVRDASPGGGHGAVGRAGQWTRLTVDGAGVYRIGG